MTQKNELAVTHQHAIAALEKSGTPESIAILDYVKAVRNKNIAVLGTDEAFVMEDRNGQIKAFKKSLLMNQKNGTLIQPLGYGAFVISAQGYEVWAESAGASVIFPKEVLVGNEWKQNPYAERDPSNRRILAVYARAVAFRYSSMGIPQVSDWTTIFDTPSYRMIDLLAKAKKFPQAFKVLPTDITPEVKDTETWAHYPFDESMNLWINTSHDEVITWLSQILNREKKAMDFAQTFAKRNALKHLSGLQKAPADNWRLSILAWRPTGNNIIKWDAAQYANLQDRVAGLIDGGSSEFENQKIEVQKGTERASEDEDLEAIEAEVDPEDTPREEGGEGAGVKTEESKPVETEPKKEKEVSTDDLPREVRQAMFLETEYPDEYKKACEMFGIDLPSNKISIVSAVKVCEKVSELVDENN